MHLAQTWFVEPTWCPKSRSCEWREGGYTDVAGEVPPRGHRNGIAMKDELAAELRSIAHGCGS